MALESIGDLCALLAIRVCQLELLVYESKVEYLATPLEQPAYHSLVGKQRVLAALFSLEDLKNYLQLAAAGNTLHSGLEAMLREPSHESLGRRRKFCQGLVMKRLEFYCKQLVLLRKLH